MILLQLEAEGKLSINDPIGKWLPQYPAWRHITIRQLLDMTSRIPDYTIQPAFVTALAANPASPLHRGPAGLLRRRPPAQPQGLHYSNTDYILAQMIIERVTHDTYADQLTRRIITPLRLHSTATRPTPAPQPTPPGCRPGTSTISAAPSLLGKAMPPLALTWAQAAGGDRQLTGRHDHLGPGPLPGPRLPPRQQRQLESLVSEPPASPSAPPRSPIRPATGSGVQQLTTPPIGTIW